MEMHQVRYFLALCEELNFARAAGRCGVSQPSLTRAMKKLEVELGGPLFHRDRGGSRLSDLGIYLRADLERIDRSVTEAKLKAEQFLAAPVAQPRLRLMEVFMRVHHVIAVFVILVIGVGAKEFLFPPKKAQADINPSANMDVRQMQRDINMHNLPIQKMRDLTFVFDSD